MSTKVHVWTEIGREHASLTLSDNTHISWFSSGAIHDVLPGGASRARPNQTFDDDCRLMEKDPSMEVQITGLDENAMKKWWRDFADDEKKYLEQDNEFVIRCWRGFDQGRSTSSLVLLVGCCLWLHVDRSQHPSVF